MLIKPSYQKPVETSEDVIARNLTVIDPPGTESIVEIDKNSPYPIVRQLAELSYVVKVLYLLMCFYRYHVLLCLISNIDKSYHRIGMSLMI